MPTYNPNPLTAEDDGTYIVISYNSDILMKIRKSDGQLLIEGGLTTDESF